jgi:hypothetical protein
MIPPCLPASVQHFLGVERSGSGQSGRSAAYNYGQEYMCSAEPRL